MKTLPLNSYPGRFLRLALATTFEDFHGNPVLMPPGKLVDVLWVCNRSKQLLDVRIRGKLYVTSVAALSVCGLLLPKTHLEPTGLGFVRSVAT